MTVNAAQSSILSSLTTIRRRVWAVLPAEDAAAATLALSQGWRVGGFVGVRGALEALQRVLHSTEGGYDLYLLCRTTAERCPVA